MSFGKQFTSHVIYLSQIMRYFCISVLFSLCCSVIHVIHLCTLPSLLLCYTCLSSLYSSISAALLYMSFISVLFYLCCSVIHATLNIWPNTSMTTILCTSEYQMWCVWSCLNISHHACKSCHTTYDIMHALDQLLEST